jgi:formate hydrogenlyase subunit 6/NADH:ubiquinone oxidoreductase subunit I
METWALPQIDLERCNRCGQCVERCPTQAVDMTAEGPRISRRGDCTYCTECEAVCPEGAITCGYDIVWGDAVGGAA